MSQCLVTFLDGVRWPETVAAVALLIQAVILFLQWKILGRHAATMEEHTGIAGKQAETAKLIGQALDQQGRVLGKQSQIMDEQFNFQKRVEAKSEREKVFEFLLNLHSRFVLLTDTLSARPATALTVPDFSARDRREHAWSRLHEAILPCQKALITAIHLSPDEKNYFIRYCQAVDTLQRSGNIEQELKQVNALQAEYADFGNMMLKAAQTPL
jgi:hypothetical protein